MEEDIQQIIEIVNRSAKIHKLKALKKFFERKFNTVVDFNSVITLESYLRSLSDLDEQTIDEIYKLITQNFTNGSPYFVMEFNWIKGMDFFKLKDELTSLFLLEEVIQPNLKKFQYLRRIGDIRLVENDYLSFQIEFESYRPRFSSGGVKEQGELDKRLEIEVTFDFRHNILYLKCGEQSYVNILKKLLSYNLTTIAIRSLSMKQLVKQVSFGGERNYNAQSYFILDFLFSKLRTNNFEANDYFAISFSNNKEEIKKTNVSGNKLFNEKTVEDRLKSFDAIGSVKFQLGTLKKDLNLNEFSNVDEVRMDFREQLKITFYKEGNEEFQRSYIHHILLSLKSGLLGIHDCQSTERLLRLAKS